MNAEYDTPLVLDSPETTASVIWLHGLGDDGQGFLPVAQLLQKQLRQTRFILPHAPFRPVTVNAGFVMRAWYDIYSMNFTEKQDTDGFRESRAYVETLLDAELTKGVKEEQIYLAGFSQGGAVALYTALQSPLKLAGVIALSCYLPLEESLAQTSEQQISRRIFLAHGQQDPLLPISMAENTHQRLQGWGHRLSWHSYPMEHAVCPEELDDIFQWMTAAT